MLPHDPTPWLMAQDGLPAVRARRVLGLSRDGDAQVVESTHREWRASQLADGSFEHSVLKTAGVLNLLADLRPGNVRDVADAACDYLLIVLESQPGYGRAAKVRPGSLKTSCDLCGFFGPYDARHELEVVARGAREMNFYREFEPLLGPKSPVRHVRRSTRDRPGPGSCYAWGLIPLAYTIEALCRAGRASDTRLRPAVNALLGAQRPSGGWCRSLGGHPSCTIHAIRALAAHPRLRRTRYADRALEPVASAWQKVNPFAAVQAAAAFDNAVARDIIRRILPVLAARQHANGTFGSPCRIERVTAALMAARAIESASIRDKRRDPSHVQRPN